MKFFQFLDKPNIATFAALNFTAAWFQLQPFFLGITWLYVMTIYDQFGFELKFVGFTEIRMVNIIMNAVYNLYFQTLGASETFIALDNYNAEI